MNNWYFDPLKHVLETSPGEEPGSYSAITEAIETIILPLYRDITPLPSLQSFLEFYNDIMLKHTHQRNILIHAMPVGTDEESDETITDNYCSKAQYREKLNDWVKIAEEVEDEDLKKEVQTMLLHEETWHNLILDDKDDVRKMGTSKGRGVRKDLRFNQNMVLGDNLNLDRESQLEEGNNVVHPNTINENYLINFDYGSQEGLDLFGELFQQS